MHLYAEVLLVISVHTSNISNISNMLLLKAKKFLKTGVQCQFDSLRNYKMFSCCSVLFIGHFVKHFTK